VAPINENNNIVFLPLNDIEAFAKAIDHETCAVMIEGIQGVGGIQIPDPGFLQKVTTLCRDNAGVAVIETAVVTPVLVLMSLGTYQVSMAVARQHELQSGADQAMAVALGGWTNENEQITALKTVLQRTTGVASDKITITRMYRCGSANSYVTDKTTCASTDVVSGYLRLKLNDTYTPSWVSYGVGQPIQLGVTRMVQVS